MSATDELRRLLDERGVEWEDDSPVPSMKQWKTSFTSFTGEEVTLGCYDEPKWIMGTLVFHTPEQAVEAALGRGTCRYVPDELGFRWYDDDGVEHDEDDSAFEDCGSASCDMCGHTMLVGDVGWFDGWDEPVDWWDEDGAMHRGYVLVPEFRYCPGCGREVEHG